MGKVFIGNVKGKPGEDGFSPTVEVASNTDTEYALKIASKDGEITTPNLKGAGKTYTKSEIVEMSKEYGLFVDDRAEATTGFWHKLFTCKTTAYSSTDIHLKVNVMQVYITPPSPFYGELNISVRQDTNGAVNAASFVKWGNSIFDISSKVNNFAVNAVGDPTGNYIELYIYNKVRYAGYRVSLIDKGSRRSNHTLTFTGEVSWGGASELTALPTNGTIIYSTLGENMVLQSEIAAIKDELARLGGGPT